MAPRKLWAKEELMVAKRTGGQRSNIKGVEAPDVLAPLFIVEVKNRKNLPHWMLLALSKLRNKRTPLQLPIISLHQIGSSKRLAVVDLDDLIGWVNDQNKTEEVTHIV